MRTRMVLVHRRTELDELLARHATRGQAEFFLRTRGRSLDEVQARHDAVTGTRAELVGAVPADWAVAEVEREDLARFLFAAEDVVVVVGPDGLVANVAKYLDGQLVLGVDPEPGANPGVLVRHDLAAARRVLAAWAGPDGARRTPVTELATVRARLDDGQVLTALNEVFVGHPSHQSARYTLAAGGRAERQSSSGLIVATGTGATGWCASIAHDRGGRALPTQAQTWLAWFVREAWPSPLTGVELTEGGLEEGEELRLTVGSDELVVFGDGMESDRVSATWGQEVRIDLAPRRLRLVV
ncbi:MAG: hypothetical protein ACTMIR_08255 [Cellulomonadaceae bacterium]